MILSCSGVENSKTTNMCFTFYIGASYLLSFMLRFDLQMELILEFE